MKPKAAAIPTATAPEPKFCMTAIVAAAALEELLVAAVPAEELVPVGVEDGLELEETGAVKLLGSRVPQLLFLLAKQRA